MKIWKVKEMIEFLIFANQAEKKYENIIIRI